MDATLETKPYVIINMTARRPYSAIVTHEPGAMMLLWLFLPAVTMATTVRGKERTEDSEPSSNVTTLYPIANNNIQHCSNCTPADHIKHDRTSWKIEAAFAESKDDEKEGNGTTTDEKNEIETYSDNDKVLINKTEHNTVEEKAKDSKEPGSTENPVKKFKPSPHLEDFFDSIDSIDVVPTFKTFGSFAPVVNKKPASGFVSSPQDHHAKYKNIPKEIFNTHNGFPYKFESNNFVRSKEPWRPVEELDSRPTAEVPVRVPAGGLYKSPDAFKNKPVIYGEDEDFGFDLHGDINESPIKKRPNPWRSLLHLVTAFIPVGLIISALTPNVITVQNTGPANNYPHNLYRRSDEGPAPAPISEPCRRRLLCELHAETNYIKPPTFPLHGKQCYKFRCEDTHALYRMLRWLFTYHEEADDQRGRHFT